MNRRVWLITGIAALAGCASPRLPKPDLPDGHELLETIFDVRPDYQGLAVVVRSHGCTTKADVAFYVEQRPGGATIAFGRRRVETCLGSAGTAELTWTWAELGVAHGPRVIVLNPREIEEPNSRSMAPA